MKMLGNCILLYKARYVQSELGIDRWERSPSFEGCWKVQAVFSCQSEDIVSSNGRSSQSTIKSIAAVTQLVKYFGPLQLKRTRKKMLRLKRYSALSLNVSQLGLFTES